MIDKYIEVNVHTIEQYELELKKEKDITCIIYNGPIEELEEYLTKNKSKSLRHTLAYLWRFNRSYFDFRGGNDDLKFVEKLSENDDPLCVFFKFIFSHMLNITVNGKTSDYYYKKCFQVGPHIVHFDEEHKGEYAEYDILGHALKYNYSNWSAWYIEKKLNQDNYFKYLNILKELSQAGCLASSAVYIKFMLNEDYPHDLDELQMYNAASRILEQKYTPTVYNEDNYRGYYYYFILANYYMHCYEYSQSSLYNLCSKALKSNLFKNIPETYLALGICSFAGFKTPIDYQRAYTIFTNYKSDVRNVDVYFDFFLGKMYKYGLYVNKDIEKAMELFFDYYPRAALEKYYYWMDNKQYHELMKHFYLYNPLNSLFKYQYNEYYFWKNLMAQIVGYVYHIKGEYENAIKVYNESVNSGGCMNNLGYLYEYNLHDIDNAFKAYKRSAEYNNPAGTWSLAQCYYYGKGTAVNMTEFKKYHELAKAMNVADAINFKY